MTKDAWYVFSTGDLKKGNGAPQIRRSSDQGRTWEYVGTVWDADTRPTWAYKKVPLLTNFWAPDVTEHDGTYYLYYAASSFGHNNSVIGVATNTTLDPGDPGYQWVDHGEVIGSKPDVDDFNAIDPGVLTAEDGTPWMAFGSFWSGIQLIQLRWPSGKPAAGAKPKRIAIRDSDVNPIEAPILIRHEAYYYLVVSRDYCCKGTDSTYQIAVGRSDDDHRPVRRQRWPQSGRGRRNGASHLRWQPDRAGWAVLRRRLPRLSLLRRGCGRCADARDPAGVLDIRWVASRADGGRARDALVPEPATTSVAGG